jgi:hypothetical protein
LWWLLLLASTLASSFSPEPSDLGHMFSISAYGYSAFTSSFPSLLWGKLMRVATLVRDLASFAGYLTLLFSIHSGESS